MPARMGSTAMDEAAVDGRRLDAQPDPQDDPCGGLKPTPRA